LKYRLEESWGTHELLSEELKTIQKSNGNTIEEAYEEDFEGQPED
jgi:hypothetical protein